MQTRKVIRFSLTGALMLNFISAFAFNQTLIASEGANPGFQEMADRSPAVEVSNELHRDEIAVDPGIQQDFRGGMKDQLTSGQSATIQVSSENINTKDAEKPELVELPSEQFKEPLGEQKEVVRNQDHFQIRADSR